MGLFNWLIFLILFSSYVYGDIVINEIMYNPEGSDNNKEFIEIYHTEQINLTNWIVGDSASNDTLTLLNYSQSNYSLIVEESFNYSEISASVYSVGATIGNNLGNTEDTVYLYDNSSNLISTITYNNSWGADGNGYTLEKIDPNGTNTEDNWAVSLIENGTPGTKNSVYGTIEIDYSQIEINEFLPNPEGYDNAPMPDGEWIELYNPTDVGMNLRWMFFKDLAGHTLYITDTTVKNTTIISANGYFVVYTNGKSGFLNNEGAEELRFYDKDGSLIKNISYIDPVEGNSYAYVEGYWQNTMATPGNPNVNHSNIQNSMFEIEKIYDLGRYNKSKFGQTIRAKVNIWKGDDSKNSISLWVEDKKGHRISKYSKISIYTRYTDHELTLPVQLYPNCDENYEDGNYTLNIGWTSGYEIKDSYNFNIKGISKDLCIAYKEIEQEKLKKFVYELASAPDKVLAGEEFKVKVKLTNNDNDVHEIQMWSYIYRGPKSYSGEREENKKELTIPRNNELIETLKNKVKEAKPGDYKLRIMIIKDNQKTPYIITRDISIVSPSVEKKKSVKTESRAATEGLSEKTSLFLVKNVSNKEVLEPKKEPGLIYESTSSKAGKLIPYLIIFTSMILNIILILKRQ
tara:strand:- start:1111 stop:2997 length:1887 start_codon:yes stop_codon:yes gene_type:complete